MAKVVLENLYKSFPSQAGKKTTHPHDSTVASHSPGSTSNAVSVLRSINLSIADGEFMVLVGPSGCGKSTLLRVIHGVLPVSGVDVRLLDFLRSWRNLFFHHTSNRVPHGKLVLSESHCVLRKYQFLHSEGSSKLPRLLFRNSPTFWSTGREPYKTCIS